MTESIGNFEKRVRERIGIDLYSLPLDNKTFDDEVVCRRGDMCVGRHMIYISPEREVTWSDWRLFIPGGRSPLFLLDDSDRIDRMRSLGIQVVWDGSPNGSHICVAMVTAGRRCSRAYIAEASLPRYYKIKSYGWI